MDIVYEKELPAGYCLRARGRLDSMAVYDDNTVKGKMIVIPYTVFAIGWGDDFIIAKTHIKDQPLDPLEPSLEKTIWCILSLRDRGTRKCFQTEEDFQQARLTLGVPQELDYQLVFPELDRKKETRLQPTQALLARIRSRLSATVRSVTLQRWLLRSVRFYRDLGFYAEHAALSDAALAAKIESMYRQEWGREIEPTGELVDLQLLAWDTGRVWWNDTEADVGRGNDVYVRTLQE